MAWVILNKKDNEVFKGYILSFQNYYLVALEFIISNQRKMGGRENIFSVSLYILIINNIRPLRENPTYVGSPIKTLTKMASFLKLFYI